MYTATRCRITLKDSATAAGFDIRTDADIITALLFYPYFQTVDTGILWEAIEQAAENRSEYDSLRQLADVLAAEYI